MTYRLQFRRYRLPFRSPMRTAHGPWVEREGALLRLETAAGTRSYGEAAPIPWFGSETVEEVEAACRDLGETVDDSRLDAVPERLGCLKNALTAARETGVRMVPKQPHLAVAALLPAGRAAVGQIASKAEMGFRVFKWKVGVGDMADELALLDDICAALPSGGKLRLDANGAWDRRQAERWLARCAECPVEFVEQPSYAPRSGASEGTARRREDDLLLGLANDFPTPIALDESISSDTEVERWLGSGWRGLFVIKPTLLADVKATLGRLAKANAAVVFSSALETRLGARDALRTAFAWAGEPRALGFGVWPLFADGRFDGPYLGAISPLERRRTHQPGGRMERAELTRLLQSTGCAEEHGGFTFLCDPTWTAADRAKFEALQNSKIENQKSKISSGWLCIPSGGSGGGVRFARHDERTLTAAVRGFCAHFGLDRVYAIGVLPPHHVSGLMAMVRCADTGGEYRAAEWKALERGELPELNEPKGGWVISLVPTQLQRLLASAAAVEWLREFQVVFIGGGPLWPELADAAAKARLPLSLSYGMTETAAMVAALRPAEFLAGDRSSGGALPHAHIAIDGEGVISVAGESVFRGYFPDAATNGEFQTDDLGRFDEHGHLHVLGRRDAVIITGGKKVQPADVEAALRASGEFTDVAVVGMPDPEWGQAVVACYPPGASPPNPERVAAALQILAAYQRPKRLIAIADWQRSAQGKINRATLIAAAQASTRAHPRY